MTTSETNTEGARVRTRTKAATTQRRRSSRALQMGPREGPQVANPHAGDDDRDAGRDVLAEFYGGDLPDRDEDRIRFFERMYQLDGAQEYRHMLLFLCCCKGMTVPELALKFDRHEATIKNWLVVMREHTRALWQNIDVKELHADFLARDRALENILFQQLDKCTEPREVSEVIRAWTQKNKLRLGHLQQAGMYEVLSVKKGREDDSAARAEALKEALLGAFDGVDESVGVSLDQEDPVEPAQEPADD